MDILYILGHVSTTNNLELRMSLRSICKYGKNIGKVIVAGYPAKWLSNEVITLDVKDRYSYKHQNILNCIENVIDDGLLDGDFLYSSDDHFYVKPVDFNNYPFFVKGELRRTANKTDPYYQYHRSLYDTRLVCERHGLPAYNFSQHCNTHMNTNVFQKCRDIIHETYTLPFGVEPTSIMMNMWMTMDNRPHFVKREDVKILNANSRAAILEQIGDRDCFSIGDSIFKNDEIYRFFKDEYGTRCIYEAD